MKLYPFKKYPGYLFSDSGEVFSCLSNGKTSSISIHHLHKIRLSTSDSGKGYYCASLKRHDGHRSNVFIHSAICESVNGDRPVGFDCSHLDGNKLNIKPSNLVWESRSDNHKRKIAHGTDDCGVRNSRSKIKDPAVLDSIRQLLAQKQLTHEEIGKMFGVNRVFITKINTNYRYTRP